MSVYKTDHFHLSPNSWRVKNDDSFEGWMKRDPILFYFNPDVNYVSLLESTSEYYVIKSIYDPNRVNSICLF